MLRALTRCLLFSCITLGACGDNDGAQPAAPRVVAIFVSDPFMGPFCDLFQRPWLDGGGAQACATAADGTPLAPSEGNIQIVFDRLLRGDKLVDVVDVDGAWRQVPIGLDAGTPALPVVLTVGDAPLAGGYSVTYNSNGKVDPDSGAVLTGVGPALTVAGPAGEMLSLPIDSDIGIHLVPEMVVSESSGELPYSGPDFAYRTIAPTPPEPSP